MSDRPSTEWCRDSSAMLKHRYTDHSHTCRPPDLFSDWTHQLVQEGTESNSYRGTGPGERLGEAVSGTELEGWWEGCVWGGLVAWCSLGGLVGMYLAAIHGVGGCTTATQALKNRIAETALEV